MKHIIKSAWYSVLYRKGAVIMAVLSVAMSIYVCLGVEHIRTEARKNFVNTVSGVDLIVGPRTGSINLLLYSVFRMGNATNDIQWASFQTISEHPSVKWTIPISLGDSHKGFRVMGTNDQFFSRFRYGAQQSLVVAQGREFTTSNDVVLGANVARRLQYKLGDRIVLAHGIAEHSFSQHDDHPFTIVGVLKPTGTPVDNALYVSLEGIEAMHKNWQAGPSFGQPATKAQDDLTPERVTAIMIGLNSKLATFKFQRWVNNFSKEPLMAILPGVVITELWQMMGMVERSLFAISLLIFIAAMFGITAMLLSSMRERAPEIRIMRALGASPLQNYCLLTAEALIIVFMGAALAIVSLLGSIVIVNQWLSASMGLFFSLNIFSSTNLWIITLMVLSVLLITLRPSIKAYRAVT